jgi:hypothetical protein
MSPTSLWLPLLHRVRALRCRLRAGFVNLLGLTKGSPGRSPAFLLLLLIVGQPRLARCEAPLPAGAIADSVGLNIHLHFGNTIYGNFPLVENLLVDLGVRHTRDGLIDTTWQEYYQRHTALGKLGIRCIFITPPTASNALLIAYPNRVPGAFEGYEATVTDTVSILRLM